MGKPRPVVLYTTPVLQHPPLGGPGLRVENSIKALSEISDLHIYCRMPLYLAGGAQALTFYRQYSGRFILAPDARRAIRYVKKGVNFVGHGILSHPVFNIGSGVAREDFGHLLRTADSVRAHVIWLGFGNISYPLLRDIKRRSGYPVVLDTDSVWSRYVLRGLPFAADDQEARRRLREGKTKIEEERWGTELADVTTAVSETDAAYYREFARDPKQIRRFSNAIDVASYEQIPAPPHDMKSPSLYVAGTFWHGGPMEDALRWVIRDVLPLVRQRVPGIHLYVLGTSSNLVLADLRDPDITVLGQVPSVLPYLSHATVALAPLRYELGTRFKISGGRCLWYAGCCDFSSGRRTPGYARERPPDWR